MISGMDHQPKCHILFYGTIVIYHLPCINMNVSHQRKCLHDILRRLHPDFLPRFKSRIANGETEKVKGNLEQITRKCNALLESLREQDGHDGDDDN
jgi:hypothetical protein